MNDQAKILVIDDELGIRRGCQRALEPLGFEVVVANSLREGRQKVAAERFDLVLLDVMMPDGRGIDLLPDILAKDPDTVPVIITGYATVELAVEAIKQGAYDFISKPFNSDLLLMTVNQGLQKRKLSLEAKRLQTIEQEAAELARLKAEAERLNEFKSAFTMLVAHELRSPVGGAQSLLRTLARGMAGELNPRQKDILGRVEARLDELMELINDLLELAASKVVAASALLETVAVQPVVQQVIDRFSAQAESKRIAITIELPEQPLVIRATGDGLGKVLGNLLGNAIKYTPEGGQVRVVAALEADQVRIAVSDTGIGIPVEALPRLGEDFFRANNAKKSGITGTGLGLSIVKQLVDQFGGQIEVQSEVGQGSTFTLYFPALRRGD